MSDNKEGRNLEEINKKKILNFGNLSDIQSQGPRKIDVSWNEAWIKCRRCNEMRKVVWEKDSSSWNINYGAKENEQWKVYLFKSQVEKTKTGYQIVGGIEFYCSDCDWKHNRWEG